MTTMTFTGTAAAPTRGARTVSLALIDDLLSQQQELTAVETFARRHEHGEVPAQAKYYRDLIPATGPGPG